MPKYEVTVDECVTYKLVVDAQDENEAGPLAVRKLQNSSRLRNKSLVAVTSLEAVDVEEVTP